MRPLLLTLSTALFAVVLFACGDQADTERDSGEFSDYTTSRSTMTAEGTFFVTYEPSQDPIPVQEIFELDVSVYESSDKSNPVTGSQLSVNAEMPTHGHGMNTDPSVTSNGGGEFTIDGMKFHMPSDPTNPWVIELTVDDGTTTDVAKFKVHTSSE